MKTSPGKINSIFSGLEYAERKSQQNLDKDHWHSSLELEAEINKIIKKWKKNPESANSPTIHNISKELSGHTTTELISMYHDDPENLQARCNDMDPECVIAFRIFHKTNNNDNRLAA